MRRVWLELVRITHDLLVWTQTASCTSRLAYASTPAPQTLRIQASWPWAHELATAFARLRTLPTPPG